MGFRLFHHCGLLQLSEMMILLSMPLRLRVCYKDHGVAEGL